MARLKIWNEQAGEWEYVNAPSGGSQTIFAVLAEVSHATPGLEDGVLVPGYTPLDGDVIISLVASNPTLWDGSTPYADVYVGSTATEGLMAYEDPTPMDLGFEVDSPIATANIIDPAFRMGGNAVSYIVDGDQDGLFVVVSQDGLPGGGAAGSTTGTLRIVLYVARAT